MSSMESLDKLQAELSGNVCADAFHTLYKLSQDVSVEHSELMAQAMKWVHKEKVEPLEDENAKLRELCERCAIELRGNGNVTDAATEVLFDDMRKLGMEL